MIRTWQWKGSRPCSRSAWCGFRDRGPGVRSTGPCSSCSCGLTPCQVVGDHLADPVELFAGRLAPELPLPVREMLLVALPETGLVGRFRECQLHAREIL